MDALTQLQAFSTLLGASCNETDDFAVSGTVAIGVYAGATLTSQALVSSVLGQLTTWARKEPIGDATGAPGSAPRQLLCSILPGHPEVYITTGSGLSSAQVAVQSWKNNTCVTSLDGEVDSRWLDISYQAPSLLASNSTSLSSNGTIPGMNASTLASRSWSSSRVGAHVGSWTRGTRTARLCRLSQETSAPYLRPSVALRRLQPEFTEYNPSSTLCSSLVVNEHVCCSAGTLPGYLSSPYENGTCYTYLAQAGDSCSSLAAAYDITSDSIETWNDDTWDSYGCSDLLAGYTICLSSGYAPQPAKVVNAECGPQLNGTAILPGGTNFSTTNECPLNACCDIWGPEVSVERQLSSALSQSLAPEPPGTAAPGQNGCISNCGTEIVVSSEPASTYAIAYFEGFDLTRPCLKPTVNQVNTKACTHVQLALLL